MNKLFVAYKPRDISSNDYLQRLKKRYKVEKAGYAGTLDPFAQGTLIVAFGSFTKLFRFLNKAPKIYECTMWLGVKSLSLDDKNIQSIEKIKEVSKDEIESVKTKLLGELSFIPPAFSAKRINGKRAYEFARKNEEVRLNSCVMSIYDCEILSYAHPFLSLRLTVSEGAYIRSYCELFAKELNINATLTHLKRIKEGAFVYENEKNLNILDYLCLKKNYIDDINKLENGSKLSLEDLKFKDEAMYFIEGDKYFSIIELKDSKISYILNKVSKC